MESSTAEHIVAGLPSIGLADIGSAELLSRVDAKFIVHRSLLGRLLEQCAMLRYRTENISARDMTYMFLVIALGLLMALSGGSWLDLCIIGAIVLLPPLALEGNWPFRREISQDVWYDRIDLVAPASRSALIQDLRARTGLDIHRIDVQQVDFLRDAARMTLYHH